MTLLIFDLLHLLCKVLLDLSLIKQLSALLEGQGELLLEIMSIFLELLDMAFFQTENGLTILVFYLSKSIVPVLVELLVLHQVSLLNLLALSSLVENELVSTLLEILKSEFLNSVLCHLGLYQR